MVGKRYSGHFWLRKHFANSAVRKRSIPETQQATTDTFMNFVYSPSIYSLL